MPEFAFPPHFLWGSAASSHQVEGHNTKNDWWAWEQASRVKESSGRACEHYQRFRDDFDLAARLGHNAHRFSVEWSRVEPDEGVFDDEALAHYRDVVRALRERHLEPIVTLHHFTTPQWLAKQGGWKHPKVVDAFARYSGRVIQALGADVRYWITINEPMVYVNMHYLDGIGPPGERNVVSAFQVIEHLVRAHGASHQALHEAARAGGWPIKVSVAKHVPLMVPCRSWWPGDRLITHLTHLTYNHAFLDALSDGVLKLPGRKPLLISDAARTLDYLGINYYSRVFMRMVPRWHTQWWGQRCDRNHHRQVTERNALKWDVYPRGIYDVLMWAKRWNCELFITENGICAIDDPQRERFILRHLEWVARAIQDGAPVLGYLYWSLTDNFEWAEGFGPRFGLVNIDYVTQARTIRSSAERFAKICRTNRLSVP